MTDDTFREAALAGRPLPSPWVIDCHSHVGAWFNFSMPVTDSENYVRIMDRMGIHVACISGLPAIGPWTLRGNSMAAAAVEQFPDRFIAYCAVNPHRPEEGERELERWKMPLLKLHPSTHSYPMDGPGYAPALRFAERNHCPVLIHVWEGDDPSKPARLAQLAETYPGITFIAGHSGGTVKGYFECIELARSFENVYLEPAGSRVYAGSIETLVTEVGDDHVLFGTDMGFIDPRQQAGRLAFSRLPSGTKRKIFGLNMHRLLLRALLLPPHMRALLNR